jgi:hypothetical protein
LLVALFVSITANLVLRTATRLLVAGVVSAADVALVEAAVEAEVALATVADEVEVVDAEASAIVVVEEVAVVLLPTVEASATSPARRRLSKSSHHSTSLLHAVLRYPVSLEHRSITKHLVILLNIFKQGNYGMG